ncbi:hypothetical protein [Segatella copri]|uniref:hypothetical protein n=1 Tax=Segatella copri TaxID=165179 RepID=UPI003F72183A
MKKLSFMVAAILVFASAPKVLMAAPAVMAEQAATEDVVDYTFDWTSQKAYNMWCADEIKKKNDISVSKEDGLTVKNETVAEHFYDIQYMIGSNVPLLKGTDYSIKIVMKGSAAGHATVAMGTWGSSGTRVEFTDQYATYTLPCTSDYEGNGFILMQSGDFVGTINVKSIEVVHSEKATTRYTFDLASVDYATAAAAGGWGIGFKSEIVDGACVISHGATTNPWDAQVNFENVFPKGANIKLSMEVKGSVDGSIAAGLQNPNGYKGCGEFPAIDLTTDYKKVDVSTMCSGEGAKRLLLNLGKYAGTVSIKNLKIEAEGVKQESLTIPSSSFATYAAYYPVNYAELGLKAYAVKLNEAKDGVEFTEIPGVVPAGVAVLLKGEADKEYALDKATGWSSVVTDLKASDGTSATSGAATLYALSTVDGLTAFYPVKKDSKIPAKRCYLEVKGTSAKAAFFSLGTNFGETTGISSVENKAEKADATVYNLAGQVVGKDYKGLVIKNGKKFVIK